MTSDARYDNASKEIPSLNSKSFTLVPWPGLDFSDFSFLTFRVIEMKTDDNLHFSALTRTKHIICYQIRSLPNICFIWRHFECCLQQHSLHSRCI